MRYSKRGKRIFRRKDLLIYMECEPRLTPTVAMGSLSIPPMTSSSVPIRHALRMSIFLYQFRPHSGAYLGVVQTGHFRLLASQ